MNDEQRERAKKRSRDWYWNNKDRVKANFARWYEKNKEKMVKRSQQWAIDNAERYRKNQSTWRARVSDRRCEQSARRRALTTKATPKWANEFFISEAYHLAKLRTKATGVQWHVDHIVPLNSKLVCGLHVEHNLRVIPGKENIRKQNKFWPDMP